MNSTFLPPTVEGEDWKVRMIPPMQVRTGMNGDTCGVRNLEGVYLLQGSIVPLQQVLLQAELRGGAVMAPSHTHRDCWGQSRAFQAAGDSTPVHSPRTRTCDLELVAPSLALQPGWAGKRMETFSCQKSSCFQISLCGESERKVETSESKRKQSTNCS